MQPLALGIGYSIYFFLILAFSVMGAIAFYVIRMIRREERALREKEGERERERERTEKEGAKKASEALPE